MRGRWILECYWSNNADRFTRLEERRKVKSAAYYARKKTARRQFADAQKSAKVDDKTKKQLAEYGY
jgi:large subunit ribosomal protein L13Ae